MIALDLYFDLDGTLVDSAGGILTSLEAALSAFGLRPAVPLDQGLIGPPLRQTLQLVAATEEPRLLDGLAAAFKAHYDTEGCLATRPYPGVAQALKAWVGRGYRMRVVTNKRLAPALAILRTSGLDACFLGIHALDETDPPAPSKASLLARVLKQVGRPRAGLLIGDGLDDGRAALANAMPFIFAEYGYGYIDDPSIPVATRIRSLSELDAIVEGRVPLLRYPGERSARGTP
jgi:phosphoglycolate phosphatase